MEKKKLKEERFMFAYIFRGLSLSRVALQFLALCQGIGTRVKLLRYDHQ